MKCPQCHSSNIRKNGHYKDKQKWECKDCGRIFRSAYATRGYSPQVCVYANYIEPEKHRVLPKTKLTRVEGENTRVKTLLS